MYAKLWVAMRWSCKYMAMRILYDDIPTFLSRAWGNRFETEYVDWPSEGHLPARSRRGTCPLMPLTMPINAALPPE